MKIKAPAPPYVGPPKWHGATSGNTSPVELVELHSTVSPCARGEARKIADYFKRTKTPSSCHYVVDPFEVVQLTWDSWVAYADGRNRRTLSVELCDYPNATTAKRWDGPNHRAMERRAAQLVAQLCLAYGVPLRYVGVRALKAGKRGITTHADVSKAFKCSTHWDLGAWRRHRFMARVRAEAKALTAEAAGTDHRPPRHPNRVMRAHQLLDQALDLLHRAPAERAAVHHAEADLRSAADKLPPF